ncbi:MAG: hypothetical protein KBG15_18685 [Kofleriaceae bacterium]|nr:hypothetical protein [Kofleriaceae bacterium]
MSWFAHTLRMLLSDGVARLMLVLHTVLAVAAVAAATHLVLWLRRNLKQRGSFASTRRFATYALVLHFAAFVLGNVMYPTYKIRVRVAYLENPVAIASDFHRRAIDRSRVEGTAVPNPEPTAADSKALAAMRMARWFDVKEHLLAFGLGALAAVWIITRRWRPHQLVNATAGAAVDATASRPEADSVAMAVLGLAVFAAATLWIGAVIGLATAAWRAI